MSKATKSGNAVTRILTYILVVLLVLGVAGVIVYLLAKDEGVTFFVEYNGERYFSGVTEADLTLYSDEGEMHEFSVKSLMGDNVDFSVSVSSNGENNFAFVYNGEFEDFYVKDDTENNDYSAAFGLQKSESGFSLTLPKDLTVEQVIEAKYGGDIQLQESLQNGVPYFVITVSDGENSLNMYFSFGAEVEGITLNPPQIVF